MCFESFKETVRFLTTQDCDECFRLKPYISQMQRSKPSLNKLQQRNLLAVKSFTKCATVHNPLTELTTRHSHGNIMDRNE